MVIPDRWRPWMENAGEVLDLRCGAGWHALIVETVDAMVETVKPDGRFAVRQVQERFGGLGLYTFDPRLAAVARAAEERSFAICWLCDAPGALREESGWYRTVCDEHSPRRDRS